MYEPHDPQVSELPAKPEPDYAMYVVTMCGYSCTPATAALVAAIARSLNRRLHRTLEIRRLERTLARPSVGLGGTTETHNSP